MLDLGLTKLALIGVVALVVIGPERLPRVARTVGALMGRAQRYVNDVKAEVSREIELDGLRSMKTEFEAAAQNVENSIHKNLKEHENEINAAWNSDSAYSGAGNAVDGTSLADGSSTAPWRPNSAPRRRSWRVQQAAMPNWYKRASLKRTRVQSGAARVARHKPASARRPARFF